MDPMVLAQAFGRGTGYAEETAFQAGQVEQALPATLEVHLV